MGEYNPGNFVLSAQPRAFVPESLAVLAQVRIFIVVGESGHEYLAFAHGNVTIFLVDDREFVFEGVHPVGRGEKSGEEFRRNAFGIVEGAEIMVAATKRDRDSMALECFKPCGKPDDLLREAGVTFHVERIPAQADEIVPVGVSVYPRKPVAVEMKIADVKDGGHGALVGWWLGDLVRAVG